MLAEPLLRSRLALRERTGAGISFCLFSTPVNHISSDSHLGTEAGYCRRLLVDHHTRNAGFGAPENSQKPYELLRNSAVVVY